MTKLVTASVMLFLIAIGYARGMYERIPQGLGGGKPLIVQLLIDPQNASTVREVINLKSSLSDQVMLVADEGDELVLLAPLQDGTKGPVRLSKRLIDGIIPRIETTSAPAKNP